MFSGKRQNSTGAFVIGLISSLVASHAQELGTNQVYIGQTGDTNTITIDQEGNSNLVGENADILRLNQFGARNTLTVDQFGFSNSIGRCSRRPFPSSVSLVRTRRAIAISWWSIKAI